MQEVIKIILAWAAFAILHSLTVSEPYERLARRVMGDHAFEAVHRLIFTAYSTAAFLLVLFFLKSLPDSPLYSVGWPARALFHAAQAAGAALLLWTPWDLKEFVGIRHWERRRAPVSPSVPKDRLFTGKAYGLVRHPLYLGISLILLFHPVHTRNSLTSAVMVVLYFYLGSYFEEARLLRKFGDEYEEYRKRVPRFVPANTLARLLGRKESPPGRGGS